MTVVPEALARIGQQFASGAFEGARVYLQPLAVIGGEAASTMVADGSALPIAGGPLAFTHVSLIVRSPAGIRRAVAVSSDLAAIAACPEPWARRVAELLDRVTWPRLHVNGQPFDRPRLMGILNMTPDSFFERGRFSDAAAAIEHARAMAARGADIIDVGGESTRPGAAPVSSEEELERLRPVLSGLAAARSELNGTQISVDTRRAAVMRFALATGVDMINDVSALTDDPDSMPAVAGAPAAIVLMHKQGEPALMNAAPVYDDVALDVFDYLESRVEACTAAGIDRRRLIVDPGIGFGKRSRHNLAVLRQLALFHGIGCPILLGVSRKGLGEGDGATDPRDRLPTSLAASLYALSQGVQILRVHDIAETRQVVDLWRRLNGQAT